MGLGSFLLGGLILGNIGSTNEYYIVDGKKYKKQFSVEFNCDVLVPVEEEL
jgi:hypothetical protein